MKLRLVTLALAVAARAWGQAMAESKDFCFRAGSYADCRRFLLLELGADWRLYSTHDPAKERVRVPEDAEWQGALDVGWMRNRADSSAVGGTIALGMTQHGRPRLAIEARRRRWFSDGSAGDLGVGLLEINNTGSIQPLRPGAGYGLTTHAGWVFGDLLTLTATVDVVQAKRTQGTLTVGARLGSWAAAGALLGGAVLLASALGAA